MRMSFGPALALGMEGENEVLEFQSRSILPPEKFLSRVNSRLPEGVRALSLESIEAGAPSLSQALAAMTFSIRLEDPRVSEALRSLQEDPPYGGLTERALMERRIAEYETEAGTETSTRLDLTQDRLRLIIPIGPGRNPRPQDIVQRLLGVPHPTFLLTREGLTFNGSQ
jgi:hypothetical protein